MINWGVIPMERITHINRILFDARQNYLEKNPTVNKHNQADDKQTLNEATDLKRIVSEANKYVIGLNTEFSIETHEGTNRTIVKMVDLQTHEVIKEFPPEEMLDIVAGIWEQAGILVDRTE